MSDFFANVSSVIADLTPGVNIEAPTSAAGVNWTDEEYTKVKRVPIKLCDPEQSVLYLLPWLDTATGKTDPADNFVEFTLYCAAHLLNEDKKTYVLGDVDLSGSPDETPELSQRFDLGDFPATKREVPLDAKDVVKYVPLMALFCLRSAVRPELKISEASAKALRSTMSALLGTVPLSFPTRITNLAWDQFKIGRVVGSSCFNGLIGPVVCKTEGFKTPIASPLVSQLLRFGVLLHARYHGLMVMHKLVAVSYAHRLAPGQILKLLQTTSMESEIGIVVDFLTRLAASENSKLYRYCRVFNDSYEAKMANTMTAQLISALTYLQDQDLASPVWSSALFTKLTQTAINNGIYAAAPVVEYLRGVAGKHTGHLKDVAAGWYAANPTKLKQFVRPRETLPTVVPFSVASLRRQ